MGLRCCAYNCKQTFIKQSGITFHSFPKDPHRRKIWTLNLRRKNFVPTDSSKICSRHFEKECFDREKFGGTWLKSTAVPTIFDFPQHLQIKKTCRKAPKKRSLSPEQSASNEQIIDNNKVEEELAFIVPTTPLSIKRQAYIGDFKDDYITCPATQQKRWEIAKKVIETQKKKIKQLHRQKRRLEKKVADLSVMLKELRNEDFISENEVLISENEEDTLDENEEDTLDENAVSSNVYTIVMM